MRKLSTIPIFAIFLITYGANASRGSELGAEPLHPVEEAAQLALDRGVEEAFAFIKKSVGLGAQGLDDPGLERVEIWMVELVDRLYELDQQDLGDAAFALARVRLNQGKSEHHRRGLSIGFLEGRLHESRGDLETAFLAYLKASEERPLDSNVEGALQNLERRLDRGERAREARRDTAADELSL